MSSYLKLEQLHKDKGNSIYYQSQLEKIEQEANGALLFFSDNSTYSADIVILAVGLKANDELAQMAELVTSNGIHINEYSQTSEPDIYAAGDVAVLPCPYLDNGRRHESWQNAQDQGIAVAKSMLGDLAPYFPKPMLWSEQLGVRIQLYGYINQGVHVVKRVGALTGELYFYLNDNHNVIGVVTWNNSRDYRVARQLVDQGKQVSINLLQDSAIPLIKIMRDQI